MGREEPFNWRPGPQVERRGKARSPPRRLGRNPGSRDSKHCLVSAAPAAPSPPERALGALEHVWSQHTRTKFARLHRDSYECGTTLCDVSVLQEFLPFRVTELPTDAEHRPCISSQWDLETLH